MTARARDMRRCVGDLSACGFPCSIEKLLGEHAAQERFECGNVNAISHPSRVRHLQSLIIRPLIGCDLIRDRGCPRQKTVEFDAEHDVRDGLRGAAVAVGKRVYPVHFPENIGREMCRRLAGPIVVDVLT